MFTSLVFVRLKLGDEFDTSTLFTKSGLDFSKVEGYSNVKKFVNLIGDSKTKISTLYEEFSKTFKIPITYDMIKLEYKNMGLQKYLSNETTLSEIGINSLIDTDYVDTAFKYWTHFSKIVRLAGFDDKKVKGILQAIKDNDKKYTIEDAINAFGLPTGYLYYMAEVVTGAMSDDSYTIGDIPPHLFIPLKDFMSAFKKLVKILDDDHITLPEYVKEVGAMMKTGVATLEGARTITIKTLYLALYPFVNALPKSKKEVANWVKDFVDLYDGVVKDTTLPSDLIDEIKDLEVIVTAFRDSMKTNEIAVPEELSEIAGGILPFVDPNVSVISNFMGHDNFTRTYGPNSVPYVIAKGDVPIVNAVITNIMHEEVNEQTVKDTVAGIREFLTSKLEIEPKMKVDVVRNLYLYASQLADFDPDVKLNDIITGLRFKPYDPETIKDTIDEFIDIIEEFEDYATNSEDVSDVLKAIKDVITADTTMGEIIKCLPLGDTIASFLSCAKTIDGDKEETDEQMAAHFKDLVVLGIKVIPTLDAWIALKEATPSELIGAIVTSTDEGKTLAQNIKKALDTLNTKGEKFVGNDIEEIFGEDYSKVVAGYKEAAKVPYANNAMMLYYITNTDFNATVNSLYKLTSEASKGKISYQTIAETGEQLNEQNEQLGKKYNKKKLSAGAIVAIVIVVLAIVGVACFAVWFFMFRGQKQEAQSQTEQITLV